MSLKKKLNIKLVTYLVFGLAFLIFLVSVVSYLYGNLEVIDFYTSVNISDSLGFDVNSSALTFGNVPIVGSSRRDIVFQNTYDFPISVKISSDGNISRILYFEKSILIEKGEIKKIYFDIYPGDDLEKGFYNGFVRFKVRRSI